MNVEIDVNPVASSAEPANGSTGNADRVSAVKKTAHPNDTLSFSWKPESGKWSESMELTGISVKSYAWTRDSGGKETGTVSTGDVFTATTGVALTLKDERGLRTAFGFPADGDGSGGSVTMTVTYGLSFRKKADRNYTWEVDPEVDIVVPCG